MQTVELRPVETVMLDDRWHKASQALPMWFESDHEDELGDRLVRVEGVGSAYIQGRYPMVRLDSDDEEVREAAVAVIEKMYKNQSGAQALEAAAV